MDSPRATRRANSCNLKRFRCGHCDKAYTKLEHLTRHERTHLNLKPFQCMQCNKGFGRQDVLNRHMRLHANTPDQTPVTAIAQQQRDGIGDVVLPATPDSPSASLGPDCLIEQPDIFDQTQLPSPNTILESDNLLEWLMPDFQSISSLPLPMMDIPGHSNPLFSALSCLHPEAQEPATDGQAGPGKHAVHQIYKLIDDLSKKLKNDLHNTGITSSFVDACLKEFFGRVSPCFPIIHEPTFSARECIPPLLLNIVALGSLFVCLPDATQKGEMLWQLGHTAVATSWQTLIGLRGPRDRCDGIQLVLTALLGQTYALLSSNSSIRTTAFVFHGLGFYWARTSGMYSVEDFQIEDLPSLEADIEIKETTWRTWAAVEVQRRATLGHYILDGLISQASGTAASARHLINNIGAACSDAAFAAKTADDWIMQMARQDNVQIPVSGLFVKVCAREYAAVPLPLSRFSTSVILEGLQSLIAELHEVNTPALGTVLRPQIIQGLMNIFDGNISTSRNTDSLQILIRWHAVCIELSTPTITLYRRICDTYKLPQVLSGVPVTDWGRPFNHATWAKSADAFRALLLAVSITRLLNEVPIGHAHAIHIPGSLFASAVILIAIHLWNKEMVKIPKQFRWRDVWASVLADNDTADDPQRRRESMVSASAPASASTAESVRFSGAEELINALNPTGASILMAPVNLMHEVNFLQISLKTIASRWRISVQMEEIIGRLAMLAS